MKNFELFMGCFGNGTTVCNKANEKHGDYEIIAHISDHGVIKFYVPENSIPPEAMERIQKCAARDKAEFMERWNKKTLWQKYEYMVEIPGIGYGGVGKFDFMAHELYAKKVPLEERVKILEEEFFKTHM